MWREPVDPKLGPSWNPAGTAVSGRCMTNIGALILALVSTYEYIMALMLRLSQSRPVLSPFDCYSTPLWRYMG